MSTPVQPGQAAPPPAAAGPEQPAGGGNWLTQKYGPLPTWGWIAVVALAGVGFILWRRSKTSSQNAATTAPSTTASTNASSGTTAADGCTDSQGNAVPCGQADYASQIAALQAEIDNLQGTASVPQQVTQTVPSTSTSTTSTNAAPATTTPAVSVPASTAPGSPQPNATLL